MATRISDARLWRMRFARDMSFLLKGNDHGQAILKEAYTLA